MNKLREFARAKINLGLRVAAREANGYHPLESLVVFADVGDELGFEPASELHLHINGPFGHELTPTADNLVLQAAKALQKASHCTKGAHITLTKNLPISSGIGGGSADAAAVLRGLNQLWACGFSFADLESIAAPIGADIPVCVQSRPRFMQGKGQVLTDIEAWPALPAVLVNPGFALRTKEVFARFDALGICSVLCGQRPKPTHDKTRALADLDGFGNDLTKAACEEAPLISELLQFMQRHPLAPMVRLCGSGATCIAVTGSVQEATQLAQTLRAQTPQYWVAETILNGTREDN